MSNLLKNYIHTKIKQLLEADETAIETYGDEIKTNFNKLEQVKDNVLTKIDNLQTARTAALAYYKNVKTDPGKVGPAVADLKKINDDLTYWLSKLDELEAEFESTITTATTALDSKISLGKAKEKVSQSEESDEDLNMF